MIKTGKIEMMSVLLLFLCFGFIACLPLFPLVVRFIMAVIAISGIVWDTYSIRSVGPKEMGIRNIFGELRGPLCDSGLHWVPRLPNCDIVTRPKIRFELDYAPRLVMSKRGEWGPQADKQIFGKQMLLITATIYTELERNFQALKDAIERGIPMEKEALKKETDSLIDSAFRDAIGSMTWGKATEVEGRETITETVKEAIEVDNSYFRLGGFNLKRADIRLRVVDLKSEALKQAMAEPDVERFHAEGARYEAERLLTETEILGKIRTALTKRGFSEEKADGIAQNIYELQVSADVQRETGLEVVKLIRFQTGNSGSLIAAAIAEGLAAFTAASGLLRPPAEKRRPPTEKRKPSEGKKKPREMSAEAITERIKKARKDARRQT